MLLKQARHKITHTAESAQVRDLQLSSSRKQKAESMAAARGRRAGTHGAAGPRVPGCRAARRDGEALGM